MELLLLADPTGAHDPSRSEQLELRYADPDRLAEHVRPFELVRLLRFIRLWRALGWSIDHTDKAITALYPSTSSHQTRTTRSTPVVSTPGSCSVPRDWASSAGRCRR